MSVSDIGRIRDGSFRLVIACYKHHKFLYGRYRLVASASKRFSIKAHTFTGAEGCLLPDNSLELLRVITWPVVVGGCCSLAVFEGALFDLEDVAAC